LRSSLQVHGKQKSERPFQVTRLWNLRYFIWLSVPIGWALADAIGIWYYLKTKTA